LFSIPFPLATVTPSKPPVPVYYYCPAGENDNPYDGYYDVMGYCVPGYISIETWFTKQPTYTYGKAVYYAPGAMEATAQWRSLDLSDYVDGVSLMSPADIGETVWIRRNGIWEGPFLSVDSARRTDMYTVIAIKQEVVEVGFETALRWGLVEASDKWDINWKMLSPFEHTVEVWIGKRPPSETMTNNRKPIYFAQHWLDRVKYSYQYESIPVYHAPYYWDMRDGNGKVCFLKEYEERIINYE
jgi:hypothetical protein